MDAVGELRRMVAGFQVSQALHVAARLGLPDHLADGPRTVPEVAAATDTHEQSLGRLMRALAEVGVLTTDDEGRFSNTELGEALRHGRPDSVAAWASFIGRPYHWQAWSALEHSVRTGENAFSSVHGVSNWEYRARHPDELTIFDAAMTEGSHAVAEAVVEAYDFGRFETIADIGGGRGALLASVLARYPDARGVLFDRPEVIAGADTLLTEAGVADRCRAIGGSFFDAVPDDIDAYIFKSVIHDWPDADSVAILSACRRAASANSTLLLVEQLLDEGPDRRRTAFSDLNMLVAPGGQERTISDYRALLVAAGFDLARTVPTASNFFVLEATPA